MSEQRCWGVCLSFDITYLIKQRGSVKAGRSQRAIAVLSVHTQMSTRNSLAEDCNTHAVRGFVSV